MTYLLKLKRTRNGTTTTHTVFADDYATPQNGADILFNEKWYFLKDISVAESAELRFSQERSMFNNKFILEKLEAE